MRVETIVQKLKNGDIHALRLIYELFYKSTFQAAFFITSDHGLAEDAVHETFLKLTNKIDQVKDPSKLCNWLCRVATNTARDIIRIRSRSTLCTEATDVFPDSQITLPENILLANEENQIIKKSIERLKPEQKQVIYLKYYKGLKINEISEALGVPSGTVKSRLIRARDELRKVLSQEDPSSHSNMGILADSKGLK